MKPSEILEQSDWTQGVLARDATSCSVHPSAPATCKFCIIGAVVKSLGSGEENSYEVVNAWLKKKPHNAKIKKLVSDTNAMFRWNDGVCKSKEEAIAMFKSCNL